MSDNELKAWIDLLNGTGYEDSIFVTPISERTFYAKVWYSSLLLTEGHTVYFIKDEKNKFVACVYDGVGDLHAFTLKKHRNKGHITNAMREDILPHIFHSTRREEQFITVANLTAERVAKKIGFIFNGEKYVISQHEFPEYEEPTASMSQIRMSIGRSKILRDRLKKAFAEIEKVSDELTMAFADSGNLYDVLYFKNSWPDIPVALCDKHIRKYSSNAE